MEITTQFLDQREQTRDGKKTPCPMPGASKFAFCWSGRHAKLTSESSLVSGNFQSKTI